MGDCRDTCVLNSANSTKRVESGRKPVAIILCQLEFDVNLLSAEEFAVTTRLPRA